MYCTHCGHLLSESRGLTKLKATFFGMAAPRGANGSAPYSCGLPPSNPQDRSRIRYRQWVQAGALACGSLAVLHILVLFGTAGAATKVGSLIGASICGFIARKLWSQNSVRAAVGALIVMWLEAAAAALVFLAETSHAPRHTFASRVELCVMAILLFIVGYQTLRSARQLRRLTPSG